MFLKMIDGVETMEIKKIGVVGFGVMGTQISQFFAQKGFDVIAIDVDESRLEQGIRGIKDGRFGLKRLLEKGKITRNDVEEILRRVKTSTSFEELEGCNLIIEAVFENVNLKLDVLKRISEIVDREAIIGSNTSTISITKLSKSVRNPENFLGIHFFNPAHIQKLVELVKGLLTGDEVFESLREFFINLGKVPILVNDSPGFATSRLGLILGREAILMVQEGVATPQDIDIGMMLGYGYAMGPLETGDLVGLDTRLNALRAMHEATGEERWAPPKLLVQLVDAGYLGDPAVKPDSRGGIYEFFGQERASQVLRKMGVRR